MLTPQERLALVLFILARDEVAPGVIESVVYEGEGKVPGRQRLSLSGSRPRLDDAARPIFEWAEQAAKRILGPMPAGRVDLCKVESLVNNLRDNGALRQPSPAHVTFFPIGWLPESAEAEDLAPPPEDTAETSDGRRSILDRTRSFIRNFFWRP